MDGATLYLEIFVLLLLGDWGTGGTHQFALNYKLSTWDIKYVIYLRKADT